MLITYPYHNNLSAYAAGFAGLEGRHTRHDLPFSTGGGFRSLAAQQADTPNHTSAHQVPQVWRVPESPEGQAAVPVGGGRGLRHPEHQRQHNTSRRHNKTARPQWGRAAVAVALGFEPRVAVTPHSISSAAPSAARTRYLTRILYYRTPRAAQIDRAGWEQGHTAAWEQGHTPQDHMRFAKRARPRH